MSSSWLCVDANLVIRLVADPAAAAVRRVWDEWDAKRRQLAAPAVLYYEVTNALYRYQKLGILGPSAVRQTLDAALALPLRLYSDVDLHRLALDLAGRFSLPAAYDAHYLALAEWLGTELWTGDARLARTVQVALPWVRLLQ